MTDNIRTTVALDPRSERGMAIVVALMAMLLLSALGVGLVLTTATETMITGNYRDSAEAMYAADAGVERVLQDLLVVPDWDQILIGAQRSAFIDGVPSGERPTPYGASLDLTKATNMLNCGKVTTCSTTDMDTWTDERPWTTNNPRWQLYAYGPLSDIIETGTVVSPMYVVVWVGDDASETDNNPALDGGPAVGPATSNPGTGQITMRAEAFGPGGIRKVIEVTVSRTDVSELERGYLAQRGQDEQNLRARKSTVQTPGKTLNRSEMGLTTGTLVSQ
jgi:ketosteroid isomerase-like protein